MVVGAGAAIEKTEWNLNLFSHRTTHQATQGALSSFSSDLLISLAIVLCVFLHQHDCWHDLSISITRSIPAWVSLCISACFIAMWWLYCLQSKALAPIIVCAAHLLYHTYTGSGFCLNATCIRKTWLCGTGNYVLQFTQYTQFTQYCVYCDENNTKQNTYAFTLKVNQVGFFAWMSQNTFLL